MTTYMNDKLAYSMRGLTNKHHFEIENNLSVLYYNLRHVGK